MEYLRRLLYPLYGFEKKPLNNRLLVNVFLFTLSIDILALAFPLVFLQTYDRVIPNNATETFLTLIIFTFIAITSESILRYFRELQCHWFDVRLEHITRCQIFDRLLKLPIDNYHSEGSGNYFEKIQSAASRKNFSYGGALIALFEIPFSILLLLVMFIIGKWIIIAPVASILIYVIKVTISNKNIYSHLLENNMLSKRKYNFIIETMKGISCIKSNAMEKLISRRFERLQFHDNELNKEIATQNHNLSIFNANVSQFTIILTAVIGGILVINELISIGALAACILLSSRCVAPFKSLINSWIKFQAIKVAENNIEEIKQQKLEQVDNGQLLRKTIKGNIRLDNVSLKLKSNIILNKINAEIEANDCIGITGKNSSGKSSIANLIMGIYSANSGQILIDGVPINKYEINHYREQIVLINQDEHLFSGTLIDNLSLFQGEDYYDKAKQIIRELGLEETIASLPNGYNTIIENGDINHLSKGVKQRLIIARAIMKDPKILIYDDASKGLDFEADTLIKSMISNFIGQCTVIIISHRPSILDMANKKYILHEGRLLCLPNK